MTEDEKIEYDKLYQSVRFFLEYRLNFSRTQITKMMTKYSEIGYHNQCFFIKIYISEGDKKLCR